MEKVSVIVPVYNVEKYIKRCLNSILEQTYKDCEIICVDDCGQDKSIQIIEEIQRENPGKIRILYGTVNQGLGAARDRGIAAARGEYITFVDSDDYLKKDYLETYVSRAEETDSDLVIGGYIRDENGQYKNNPTSVTDSEFAWTYVTAVAKLYRRRFLEKNNLSFKGIRRYEDEGFTYRLMVCNPRISMLSYEGYFYYLNNESITKSVKKDRSELIVEYFHTVDQLFEDISDVRKNRELIRYCLISGLVANMLYNGKGCGKNKMSLLYNEYKKIVYKIDPQIGKNKYIKLRYLKSEPWKKRWASWVILHLQVIHMDRLVFYFISLL